MNKKTIKKLKKHFNSCEDLDIFLTTPLDLLWEYQYTFGNWIKNSMLIKKTSLIKRCENLGITLDDMASAMMSNFYIELKHKKIKKC